MINCSNCINCSICTKSGINIMKCDCYVPVCNVISDEGRTYINIDQIMSSIDELNKYVYDLRQRVKKLEDGMDAT